MITKCFTSALLGSLWIIILGKLNQTHISLSIVELFASQIMKVEALIIEGSPFTHYRSTIQVPTLPHVQMHGWKVVMGMKGPECRVGQPYLRKHPELLVVKTSQ